MMGSVRIPCTRVTGRDGVAIRGLWSDWSMKCGWLGVMVGNPRTVVRSEREIVIH
jgi:hypothetical protein